jgi:large subunit ribosomal protein L25
MNLNATKREEVGKHIRRLRRAGQIPAVVYGHHAKPLSLSIEKREFEHVFKRVGHTQLVDLAVDGGRANKVLIKEIQIHPRFLGAIHVDLLQVSMTEKLQVQVPIHLVGTSPIVEQGEADILHVLHQVRVECLPGNIPESMTLDVSSLLNIGDQLHVSDLPAIENVTILDDPEETVVKAAARRELVTAEEEAEDAAAGAEAGAEGEAAATDEGGEARAEGEGEGESES